MLRNCLVAVRKHKCIKIIASERELTKSFCPLPLVPLAMLLSPSDITTSYLKSPSHNSPMDCLFFVSPHNRFCEQNTESARPYPNKHPHVAMTYQSVFIRTEIAVPTFTLNMRLFTFIYLQHQSVTLNFKQGNNYEQVSSNKQNSTVKDHVADSPKKICSNSLYHKTKSLPIITMKYPRTQIFSTVSHVL